MPKDLHPLLLRQLRRVGLDAAAAGTLPDALPPLLERVSRAYAESDQDRYLLERSQELASREMGELHAELKASQARLASLVSLSSDWVWEQGSDRRFSYVSAHVSHAGVDLAAALLGKCVELDLFAVDQAEAALHQERIAAREPFRNHCFGMAMADGQPFYIRISGEPVFEGDEFRGYRGVGSDVTQSTLAEQHVQKLARYDSLTGLANRSLFMSQLEHALGRASQSEGGTLAVFFVDLDHFKTINDTLGHDAGDELLKTMAARLTGLLRGADTVGRLGGDEFVILVDACADPSTLSKVASRVLTVLCEPLRLANRQVQISASVGISLYPADGSDAAGLLKCADTAMYQAKALGKNNFQFFTPQLAQRAARHFRLEGELREGIARGELRLHYQPKFDLASGRLSGMEALVRWQHPQRGLLLPAEFLDLAEESGQIAALDRWVLDQACQQLRRWRDEGLDPPRCAINLSARQFASATLIEDLHAALSATALESGALDLEVSEGLLMADPERAQTMQDQLHRMGLHIAIDNFGTGYSSLTFLKRFAARTLKIDRSFIAGMPAERDVAITKALIALAHGMGMRALAEGVETPAQLELLRGLDCDEVQGYLLGRPQPTEAWPALLAAPQPLPGPARA